MTPDFQLFEVLTRHGVPFVVVGGHAVNFHGFIRGTEDTDVLWIRSPAAEASLLEALEKLVAEYIGNEIDPATGIERTHPVTEAFIRAERLMMLCTRAVLVHPLSHGDGRASGEPQPPGDRGGDAPDPGRQADRPRHEAVGPTGADHQFPKRQGLAAGDQVAAPRRVLLEGGQAGGRHVGGVHRLPPAKRPPAQGEPAVPADPGRDGRHVAVGHAVVDHRRHEQREADPAVLGPAV
jgi:hypothetical protein